MRYVINGSVHSMQDGPHIELPDNAIGITIGQPRNGVFTLTWLEPRPLQGASNVTPEN